MTTWQDIASKALALPEDERNLLIDALRNPPPDWADDVWAEAVAAWEQMNIDGHKPSIAVIRKRCRPAGITLTTEFLREGVERILRKNLQNPEGINAEALAELGNIICEAAA